MSLFPYTLICRYPYTHSDVAIQIHPQILLLHYTILCCYSYTPSYIAIPIHLHMLLLQYTLRCRYSHTPPYITIPIHPHYRYSHTPSYVAIPIHTQMSLSPCILGYSYIILNTILIILLWLQYFKKFLYSVEYVERIFRPYRNRLMIHKTRVIDLRYWSHKESQDLKIKENGSIEIIMSTRSSKQTK